MEIYPIGYNEYLERVKIDGWLLADVPKKYLTEELCKIAVTQHGYALKYVPVEYKTEELVKIAVNQNGLTLYYVPDEYMTEELLFIARETRLYYDHNPTVLTKRIFDIYETMGE